MSCCRLRMSVGKIKDITAIVPQRVNANKHTPRGMGELERSIGERGWIGAITAAADGEVFDGSARREVLETAGLEDAIFIESDGTRPIVHIRTDIASADDPKAKQLALEANFIAAHNFAVDAEVLARLSQDFDLSALVYPDELAAILASVEPPDIGGAGDEFDTTPQDGPTRTQAGELWEIDGGRHRLMVGDATNPLDVDKLLGDDKFEMVWTDPPYGVAIGDKNKYLNAIARSNRVEENLENDTLDEDGLLDMLRGAFALAAGHCLAGGAWYVAAPPGPLHVLFGQALKELGIWHQTIQWVKNNATFAPLGVDYHWRAEPIFYGWLPGAAHRYYGGRQQDTVWEIDRPMASPEHPTMKPIALVQRAIENSSKKSEIVYDPFLGSGTSIIAAHAAQRRCFGLEISPRYADVVLARASAAGLSVARRDD